jgi:hypothetical protein
MVNIIINAVFGDGSISTEKNGKSHLHFNSTNKSIIEYKARLINGNCVPYTQLGWGTKQMYKTSKVIPSVGVISKLDLINQISLDDFYLWYLDDGSYHKTKHFMNLNSHSLTRAENMELQFHLWQSLGIETQLANDNKKDGRSFFYLRIKRNQAESLKPEIKSFMCQHNIKGFEYKIGSTSTTIEQAI